MSEAEQLQPDDEPAIQEFLNEFGKRKPPPTWRLGRVGPANNNQIPYVSGETLRTKLDLRRVQNLLNALFRNWDKPAPDADYIRKNCLRTFAILLAIGYGRIIYIFAKHPNLHDQHLPHLQEPQDFPSSTKVNLFSHFYEKQWAFCAQTMKYDMGYRLPPNIILPILNMDVIYEEGGSATMYKIQVDEDYNELQPEDDNDRRIRHQHRHTFALKTYRTKDARKYYETESDAFKHLRHNNRPPQNIIAFYGGFERENMYNIILEFADGGSLDEFMERTPAPPDSNQLSVFWNQFFSILNGLAIIHGEGNEDGNEPRMLLGWHQDINPTNILVKSRPNASCPYDVHFKIADLGLSHFKMHTSGLGKATDKDTFGTRAYGAPETYRADFHIENSTLRVKQDVDIWSTGCVLSEVVTWVSQGWDKVLDYRRRRREETYQLSMPREDCFHDRWGDLLQTVRYVHQEDVERRPRHDELTQQIIDGLINEMLLPNEHRPNAKYLYQKSKRTINPHPQSPPPKRPPLGHSSLSGGSSYLEPKPTHLRSNSLSSSNFPGDLPRNRSGSFHSLSSVQNNQNRREYQDPKYYSPSSQDENSYFSPKSVYDVSNEYVQARKVDNRDPSLRDHRPSMNGPATLSPTSETKSTRANKSEDLKPPPALSVDEGLDYIRNKLPFPEEHLMEELQGRDHAFLVDNSTSSGEYRLQMKKVLELLARKVENADSSLDLYFTAPYRKLKRQNTNAILNEFDSTGVREMPNIRSCLARILDEYQDKLGKLRPIGKLKHPKTTPLVGCRKLSLYVLTDGIWQPNVDLVQEIQTLVEHLAEKKLTNKQVGIQFIRFGQNPQAIRKMKRLDSGSGLRLNIVDTTPANGNVWKMLLGSINPWFDADYDSEDTESGYKGEPDVVGLGFASVDVLDK